MFCFVFQGAFTLCIGTLQDLPLVKESKMADTVQFHFLAFGRFLLELGRLSSKLATHSFLLDKGIKCVTFSHI